MAQGPGLPCGMKPRPALWLRDGAAAPGRLCAGWQLGGRSWTAQGLTPSGSPALSEDGHEPRSLQSLGCRQGVAGRGGTTRPPSLIETGKPEQRRPVGWEGRQAWQTRYSAPWEEQKLPLLARHQTTRVMFRSWDSRPRPPRESCLPPASVSFPPGNGDSQVSQTGQSLEPEGQGPGCLCRKSPVAAP